MGTALIASRLTSWGARWAAWVVESDVRRDLLRTSALAYTQAPQPLKAPEGGSLA